MAKRWYTADWHLGFDKLRLVEHRPFKTIEKHDAALLRSACQRAKEEDTIIHVGDLACFGQDSHLNSSGLNINPMKIVSQIPATFVNIRGNHDINNRVKSLCDSMQLHLGKKFPNVICGHYPSYDIRAKEYVRNGWIVICGHVHHRWKHCLDLDHSCLNINVGVDEWKYNIISEDELMHYIECVLKMPKEKITKVKIIDGKIKYV